jgi:hypothetical protein
LVADRSNYLQNRSGKMNKSESIKELAGALSKAQGEIKGALKDTDNPFFKSKYADLASVVEAIRAPLAKHGIAYVQLTVPSEKEEVQVETVLMHESGEWVSGIIAVPVSKGDAQGYGSALTYARRYGLSAAVGVAPEDDDGNAAAKAAPAATSRITPTSGAGDDLTNPQKSRCMDVSIVVKDFLARKARSGTPSRNWSTRSSTWAKSSTSGPCSIPRNALPSSACRQRSARTTFARKRRLRA